MSEIIKVGMADLNVYISPDGITTLGLGSCVGIALRDPVTGIGGLAHIMLPDSTQSRANENRAKFADTGIPDMVDEIVAKGASRSRLVAKLAGGSQMFVFASASDIMSVGKRNAAAAKEKLQEMKIPIVAEDTGGNYGRTVQIDLSTGVYKVKTIDKADKEF